MGNRLKNILTIFGLHEPVQSSVGLLETSESRTPHQLFTLTHLSRLAFRKAAAKSPKRDGLLSKFIIEVSSDMNIPRMITLYLLFVTVSPITASDSQDFDIFSLQQHNMGFYKKDLLEYFNR